jgi:hypothetical protein
MKNSYSKESEKMNRGIEKNNSIFSILNSSLLTLIFLFGIVENGWGQSVLLDPAGAGGFEGSHGWTLTAYGANENRWYVGSSKTTAGTNGLYVVSWSSTTTYGYDAGNTSTGSHAYKSISFPAGATNISLSFKVLGGCDLYLGSCYDRVKVGFSSGTPTGNSETGITNVWNQTGAISSFTTQTVSLSSATYAGTTQNLVITWINDASGTVAAGAIDEISITYTPACSAPTLAATTAATQNSCLSYDTGGNVTAEGGCAVTARGVCYAPSTTTTTPTTANSTVAASGTTGSFISTISGLSPNTTYYVRSYATNSSGTSYGASINFTTGAVPGAPNAITPTTACANTTTVFTTSATNSPTSYSWTLPAGWTGSSTGTTITATPNTTGGSIVVTATNGCGTSSQTNTSITISNPVAPVLNSVSPN